MPGYTYPRTKTRSLREHNPLEPGASKGRLVERLANDQEPTRKESAGGRASAGSQPFAIIARPMKCICAFT